MPKLDSRIAIVTGGGSGIGESIAVTLAQEGATVVVCDVVEDAAHRVAQRIGGGALAMKVDVGNGQEVDAVVKSIAERFGRIDILVNNAGITRDMLLVRMTDDDWERVLKVNLSGTFFFTRAVARYMMKGRYGRIVNIASIIGLGGNAGQANYAASKAGIIALTKSCAKELASRSIRVNAIAPGFIETPMTAALPQEAKDNYLKTIPLGRFGKPEDVARVVVFLASDDSAYITGQVLVVDGGMVMA
jgi:3-oxoacyl-[acyl-carrier protein] reductase